uniref:Uncharacterized protein n=1 Tax=Aplanochytrium stocchinoi TaxID=215587 RepID=A0A7S3PQH6_9STRA
MERTTSQKVDMIETFIERHLEKRGNHTKQNQSKGMKKIEAPSNSDATSQFKRAITAESKVSKKYKSKKRNTFLNLSTLEGTSVKSNKAKASKKKKKSTKKNELNIVSKLRENSNQKPPPGSIKKTVKIFRKKLRLTTKRTIKKASRFLEEYKKEKIGIITALTELVQSQKTEKLRAFKEEQEKRTEIIKSYMNQLKSNQDEMNLLESKHETYKADFEKAYESHKARNETNNKKQIQLFKDLKEEVYHAESGLAGRVAELKRFTVRKIAGLKKLKYNADKQAKSFREKISLFSSI